MDDFITAEEVCEINPRVFSTSYLAQHRYRGTGPRYYKPSPRKVLYKRSEVLAWLESQARTGTAEVA